MYCSTSTNFAQYGFFQVPKIVLDENPLQMILRSKKFVKIILLRFLSNAHQAGEPIAVKWGAVVNMTTMLNYDCLSCTACKRK